MIVLDASVVVGVVAEDDADARRLRERLASERLFAPELVDIEVTSAIRRARRAGRIGAERAVQALADLAFLPLARVSHTPLIGRVWDLRDNLTPYDAAYVALAETLNATLFTRDVRLSRAPDLRCEVVVLS
jgi:predicted nucleic acid-binding protein